MTLGLRGQKRRRRWPFVLGATGMALAVLVTLWDWVASDDYDERSLILIVPLLCLPPCRCVAVELLPRWAGHSERTHRPFGSLW